MNQLDISPAIFRDHDLSDWAMRHVLIEKLVRNALSNCGRRASENRRSEVGCGSHRGDVLLCWCVHEFLTSTF